MKRKILIIDDDIEILEILKLFLEIEDFKVVTAQNGITGFNLLQNNCYDLILLDLGLPDIDGEHICKKIREKYDTPIIVLTAKETVSNKVLCFEYGCDDYITKPFEKIELLARIKAVLRRTKNTNINDKVISFPPFEINLEEGLCYKNGKHIDLTKKELEILSFLIRNAGKNIKRDEIIKEIWGDDSLYRWSRTLDVHIQHLRQKIEKNPKKPYFIKTVPGVGYKFEC
ncbi:response regulator transcription factor [Deferribacter abyssi]|uniref:response regulator transcription factor n=1 Tax=Deferribacter abyssi TaxID=213806 RepID=UPI003C2A7DB8